MNSLATWRVVNPAQEDYTPFLETMKEESTLSMVVVGAARLLVRRKIFHHQRERERERERDELMIFGILVMTSLDFKFSFKKKLTWRYN